MSYPEFNVERSIGERSPISGIKVIVGQMLAELQSERQMIIESLPEERRTFTDIDFVTKIYDRRIAAIEMVLREVESTPDGLHGVIGFIRGILTFVTQQVDIMVARPPEHDTNISVSDTAILQAVEGDLTGLLERFNKSVDRALDT